MVQLSCKLGSKLIKIAKCVREREKCDQNANSRR